MKNGTVRTAGWYLGLALLAALVAGLDFKTGTELNFFVFYFLPVGLAAWYVGRGAAVFFSILSAGCWFASNHLAGLTYSSPWIAVWNTLIRLAAFALVGWSFSELRSRMAAETEKAAELRKALAEIKVLKGILPVCSECKKIRSEDGTWKQIETYVSQHSEARFSHGYCPECYRKALAEAGLSEPEGGP